MTEAKILIGLQNGKIGISVQIGKITQAELAMIITHLELIKDDLKLRFTKGVKKVET